MRGDGGGNLCCDGFAVFNAATVERTTVERMLHVLSFYVIFCDVKSFVVRVLRQ